MSRIDLSYKQRVEDLDRYVTIETRNGQVYEGKIEAFTDSGAVALSNVKVKDSAYSEPEKEEAVTINMADMRKYTVDQTGRNDDFKTAGRNRRSKGGKSRFANDREYGAAGSENNTSAEFQEWEPHDDVPHVELDGKTTRGWTVEEMYKANNMLGVTSSYKDLECYSTAAPVGDRAARKQADRIAKEIEKSAESRNNAKLENDDEERDILGSEDERENHSPGDSGNLEAEDEDDRGNAAEVPELVSGTDAQAEGAGADQAAKQERADGQQGEGEEDDEANQQHFSFNPNAPEFVPQPGSVSGEREQQSPAPLAFVPQPPPISMPMTSYAAIPQIQPLTPTCMPPYGTPTAGIPPMYLYMPPTYPIMPAPYATPPPQFVSAAPPFVGAPQMLPPQAQRFYHPAAYPPAQFYRMP
ncbi:LsmAD domain protein [Aphelenchoides fujianensis]|nr:LsmAD domain protein [Aphelenchoides fujianensis]